MVGHTGAVRSDFAVPVTSGNYAPEVIELRKTTSADSTQFSNVLEVVLVIEALPTGAAVETDVLNPGFDPDVDASWVNIDSQTTTGLKSSLVLFALGVRVRVKSGGTSGTAKVIVSYLY